MKVVEISGQSRELTHALKQKAIKLIEEHDSFVLAIKEPVPHAYSWTACNIANAELITIGGLLLYEGAADCRDVTPEA
jgi:hypothetical protein